MPRNIIQTNFAGGELSPKLAGRVDFPAFAGGAETLKNCIVQPQGSVTRRPGTHFVAEVKDSATTQRLEEFVFNEGDAYVLEFGNLYVRFYQNNGQVKESLAVTAASWAGGFATITIGAHSATVGDIADVAGIDPAGFNGSFVVTAIGGTTITYALALDPGAYVAGGSAKTPYEIATPYTEAELPALSLAQSGDVVYIAHGSHAPQKLRRLGAISFDINDVDFQHGPFQALNITTTLLKASAVSGSVTITATAAAFVSTDVGRLIRFRALVPVGRVAVLLVGGIWTVVGNRFENGDRVRVAAGTTLPTDFNETDIFYVTESDQTLGQFKLSATLGGAPITSVDGVGFHAIGSVDRAKWSWGKITAYTSATEVTVLIKATAPAGNAGRANTVEVDPDSRFIRRGLPRIDFDKLQSPLNTGEWVLGEWSDTTSQPSQVAFFQQRLCFAASADKPQTVWMSVSADFEHFKPTEEDDTVVADNAITATVASGRADKILWLAAARSLIAGTEGAPKAVGGGREAAAVAATNISIRPAAAFGAAPNVSPITIGNDVLYAQKGTRKLRAVNFRFEQDSFAADDLTLLADHITQGGISAMAYADQPDSLLWCQLANGKLTSLTYDRDQQMAAWAPHEIAGVAAAVESLTSIPTDAYDQLWMVVKRTINGQTKRYVEYMAKGHERGDLQADAHYVDSGLTYNGPSTTTLSGLGHLEGESVIIHADGAEHIPVTVTGGQITLKYPVTKAHVGLAYNSDIKPMPLSVGNRLATIQGRPMRITQTTARLYEAMGLKYGGDFDALDELDFRDPDDIADAAIPLFTGDVRLTLDAPHDTAGQVAFRMGGSSPGTLLAMIHQYEVEGRQ